MYGWSPFVPVAEKLAKARKKMEQLRKKGHPVSPVILQGKAIAHTFWGKAWCDNLESYSDFANRLPRGRTYVRNGSVVDLQIGPGQVSAHVAGSEVYRVTVKVKPLPMAKWKALCTDCAGSIDSLVELLQGRFSKGVMARICRQQDGLFPSPSEITLDCSCPDWADMCKHVAATLYGIGARLDEQPELLFLLRGVDGAELVAQAARGAALETKGPQASEVIADQDLADLFGLDMGTGPEQAVRPEAKEPEPARKGPGRPRKTVEPQALVEAKPKAKPVAKAKPDPKAATRPATSPSNRSRPAPVATSQAPTPKPRATKVTAKPAAPLPGKPPQESRVARTPRGRKGTLD